MGVEVVDYTIINQPVEEPRMGKIPGTIAEEYGEDAENSILSGACWGEDHEFDDGQTVSFVVLQIRMADPEVAGAATGLRLETERGASVEPMTLVLCPHSAGHCEEDSAPEDFGKFYGE